MQRADADAVVAGLTDTGAWQANSWNRQAFAGIDAVLVEEAASGDCTVVVRFRQADRSYELRQTSMRDFMDLEVDAQGLVHSMCLTIEEPHGTLFETTAEGRFLLDED